MKEAQKSWGRRTYCACRAESSRGGQVGEVRVGETGLGYRDSLDPLGPETGAPPPLVRVREAGTHLLDPHTTGCVTGASPSSSLGLRPLSWEVTTAVSAWWRGAESSWGRGGRPGTRHTRGAQRAFMRPLGQGPCHSARQEDGILAGFWCPY